MDSDTKINCYDPQLTQREASDISGVDMHTINNWLQRGEFALQQSTDRRLQGRRLFSIADVAALHTMHYCVKMLDMKPAAAAVAGKIVHDQYRFGLVGKSDDGRFFEIWHLMSKPNALMGIGDDWSIQGIWQDRKSGAFYHYNPKFHSDKPFGFPHFPCLSIPTSEIGRRIFLRCSDLLIESES